jgi:ubiquinone/menaquinone biosynthesis C-methylase UbiE
MNVKPGMTLLEVGPGPGTFTFAAARQVGERGRIFAIDIQEPVINLLHEKIRRRGVSNIYPEQASAYDLPYADKQFDRVYMVTVLGEIPDKQRALVEFRRVLKYDGTLAIGEIILDPDYPRRSTVIKWCRKAGFEVTETYGNLLHYLLLFSKA